MLDIIQYGFGIILLIVMGYFTYISSVLISEKKDRRRKGISDYYDNPIKKDKE